MCRKNVNVLLTTVIVGFLFLLYKSLTIKQVICIIRSYFLPLTGKPNFLKAAHFAFEVHILISPTILITLCRCVTIHRLLSLYSVNSSLMSSLLLSMCFLPVTSTPVFSSPFTLMCFPVEMNCMSHNIDLIEANISTGKDCVSFPSLPLLCFPLHSL